MKNSAFKDHFSHNAKGYNKFRPDYPDKLFEYLTSLSPSENLAWDCGTGSGQVAITLAKYFKKVIAIDASKKQLENAKHHERVNYAAANAEKLPVRPNTIDLITVAHSLHWFDSKSFFTEVERVLKAKGIIAVWTYNLLPISPELDEIINKFYYEIVGCIKPL